MKKFVHVLKEKLNQGSSQDYVRQQQTPYNHPSQATLLPISGFVLEEILQWNASKFAIFHVLEVVASSIFHFMLCIILFFTIMSWSMIRACQTKIKLLGFSYLTGFITSIPHWMKIQSCSQIGQAILASNLCPACPRDQISCDIEKSELVWQSLPSEYEHWNPKYERARACALNLGPSLERARASISSILYVVNSIFPKPKLKKNF